MQTGLPCPSITPPHENVRSPFVPLLFVSPLTHFLLSPHTCCSYEFTIYYPELAVLMFELHGEKKDAGPNQYNMHGSPARLLASAGSRGIIL